MKAFNHKGIIVTFDSGKWRDSGGLVMSNWWQDRLSHYYRNSI